MREMTDQEIRDELRNAEQRERDARRRYARSPSWESSNEVDSAVKSVRWWAIQLAHTGGRG